MAKRAMATALAAFLGLGACQSGGVGNNNETYGTAGGAVAGAVLGAVIAGEDNRWLGGLLGAVVGGAIGNRVGNYLDADDEEAIANSTEQSLNTGETVAWSNPENNTRGWSQSGEVTQATAQTSSGRTVRTDCKPYTAVVIVGEERAEQTGTACRDPQTGEWVVQQ